MFNFGVDETSFSSSLGERRMLLAYKTLKITKIAVQVIQQNKRNLIPAMDFKPARFKLFIKELLSIGLINPTLTPNHKQRTTVKLSKSKARKIGRRIG